MTVIRDKRIENGLKAQYVAKQIGMTRERYSRLERGKRKTDIPMEYLVRLAEVFKCEVADLREGVENDLQ